MRIMLDPGHGGGAKHNRGFLKVTGFDHSHEGEANFIFCDRYFKPALEKVGFEVSMTRKTINEDPSLSSRGKMAKGYDILLSSHTNSGGGTGVEVWDSTNPSESIESLTDKICLKTSQVLGIPNRGTKYKKNSAGKNWYGILRHGQAKHNFIVEWCFHDKRSDVESYVKNMKPLADEVAKVIADHFGLKSKEEKPMEHWAQKYIDFVEEEGLMVGDEKGFRPDEPVTRAELAVVLSRLLEKK